jgi:hypothetical protein
MPDARAHRPARSTATLAAIVAAAVALLGALLLFGSYLLHREKPVLGTPGPRAAFTASEFTLPAHQRACMSGVTISPHMHVAQFELREPPGSSHGSPPIDVLLSGPGYEALAHAPSEQSEGPVEVQIEPPPRSLIGSVCLINRGPSAAILVGSREPRSRTRSQLTIAGKPTSGDIALTFLSGRPRTRLSRLAEVFDHASDLTDQLIPAWLIWIVAISVALGVPLATVAVVRRALAEDEVASR